MKKILKFVTRRIVIVSSLILLQLGLLLLVALGFANWFVLYYLLSMLLSLIVTLRILGKSGGASYKIAWLAVVLLFPVFGALLYIIFCGNQLSERRKRKMVRINDYMFTALPVTDEKTVLLERESPEAAVRSRYISAAAHCPLYDNTAIRYYPVGDDFFEPFLDALRTAERYIFLEYFIIGEGVMWDMILSILTEKAKAGVDVRLVYDDLGCISLLPLHYADQLSKLGIQCRVFNRFSPMLAATHNNRDHRKIVSVDGRIAFTGGVNLSDEYINRKVRFGHWKDSALELRGDAAWSMTVMFLTMWDLLDTKKPEAAPDMYDAYRPAALGAPVPGAGGWVQPYTDNPLDNEPVGEKIYLQMIQRAKKYVWIMTPYLVIDDLIESALCTAAQSGVDVRILMPGIGDKYLVYEASRSNYENLMKHGVRIYEYTPGFLHSKNFLSDDVYGTVGTVNLDFRSLYLHFENGVWLYHVEALEALRLDFIDTMAKSREIQPGDYRNTGARRLFREVISLITPMF